MDLDIFKNYIERIEGISKSEVWDFVRLYKNSTLEQQILALIMVYDFINAIDNKKVRKRCLKG